MERTRSPFWKVGRSLRRTFVSALVASAALVALVPASAGAALDTAGTEFWLGFPSNNSSAVELTLFITGAEATSGTVEIPGLAFSEAFTVTPGAVTSVVLPSGAQMSGTGTQDKGVHVTAQKEVVVYGLNRQPATTDAYLGLPIDALGTSYTVLGWGAGDFGRSEFSVVAPEDGTTVTITPSVAGAGGRAAGVPFTVALDQGEQFQLQAAIAQQDLTGTKVTSDKPVSLFSGHSCASIPNRTTVFCDHVVEQTPPESTWGTSFLTVPLKTRQNGDTFVFVASQDDSEVRVDGVLVATLDAGQRHQRLIAGQAEIQATKPILMAQYSNGTSFDGVTSDPFEMQVPPSEQYQTGYTVTTPASGFRLNFINIVARTSAVGSIKVDGVAVPAGDFSPIGSSGFSGAQVDVSVGSHTLTGDGQPFGAFVYGFDSADSYGYAGGLSLAPVATVKDISLSPATATSKVGNEHCVTATVTDSNGDRVAEVRVDFTISGANPTSGNSDADSNGEAVFCYTGNKTGEDTIGAATGRVSSTDARKTWTLEDAPPPRGDDPVPPPTTPPGEPDPLAPATLRIHHRALVELRRGRVVLILRCRGAAGQRCAGSMTLTGTTLRSRLVAAGSATGRFDVAAGGSMRMSLKPTKLLLRMLSERRKAIGRATARVRNGGGSVKVERLLTIQTVRGR